jgi:hypothetical protein
LRRRKVECVLHQLRLIYRKSLSIYSKQSLLRLRTSEQTDALLIILALDQFSVLSRRPAPLDNLLSQLTALDSARLPDHHQNSPVLAIIYGKPLACGGEHRQAQELSAKAFKKIGGGDKLQMPSRHWFSLLKTNPI